MSVKPIEFYLQKTLPAVFDDSLSYYEAVAKLMSKINEIIEELTGIRSEWDALINDAVKTANSYTDEQIANYNQQFQNVINQLNTQYAAFNAQVTQELNQFDKRLTTQEDKEEADIIRVGMETDEKIKQNTDYIFEQIAGELVGIKVINYFTGMPTSIQDMFDYLAQFHTENAITYSEMIAKGKTYSELADLNITYTQLAINGKLIYN